MIQIQEANARLGAAARSGRVTAEGKVRSLIQCAQMCFSNQDCVHYAYSSATNMCHVIVPDGCGNYVASPGWHIHTMI